MLDVRPNTPLSTAVSIGHCPSGSKPTMSSPGFGLPRCRKFQYLRELERLFRSNGRVRLVANVVYDNCHSLLVDPCTAAELPACRRPQTGVRRNQLGVTLIEFSCCRTAQLEPTAGKGWQTRTVMSGRSEQVFDCRSVPRSCLR